MSAVDVSKTHCCSLSTVETVKESISALICQKCNVDIVKGSTSAVDVSREAMSAVEGG